MNGRSIQFDIAAKLLLISAATTLSLAVIFLLASFICIQIGIEDIYGMVFFSREFAIALIISACMIFIISSLVSLVIGIQYGRILKVQLMEIRDAGEMVSRGKMDGRAQVDGPAEIKDIAEIFNELARRIEKQVESLQRLSGENTRLIENAQEHAGTEERRKLARELHDAVSQQLFAVMTMLSAIPLMMENDPDEAKKYIHLAEDIAGQAQQELRALIMHLRPVSLEGEDLVKGIRNLLNETGKKNKNITIKSELNEVSGIPAGIEDNLFRVIQEAVSNILRHSKATVLSVKLFGRKKVLNLLIEDNGVGFNRGEKRETSYGLRTMQERIEEIGGRFDVISFPGKGTRIEIRVPIDLQTIYK